VKNKLIFLNFQITGGAANNDIKLIPTEIEQTRLKDNEFLKRKIKRGKNKFKK